jgi:hypothetical protein
MQLVSIKAVIALVWVSTVSIAGIAANFNSFSGWTILAAAAVIPPLVMTWLWAEPSPSMSESIQEALR